MPPAWPSFIASKRKPIQPHPRTSSRTLIRRSSVPSCVVSIEIQRSARTRRSVSLQLCQVVIRSRRRSRPEKLLPQRWWRPRDLRARYDQRLRGLASWVL